MARSRFGKHKWSNSAQVGGTRKWAADNPPKDNEDVSSSLNNSMPHGAKGFDFGKAVLVFAKDKLLVKSKTMRQHLTVHSGTNSQVLDIHQTCTAVDGSITHTTLFTISHANLAAMMQNISLPAIHALMGILCPLRPGWMAKRHVGVVVGLVPTEAEIPHLTKLRHKKLVVDKEKLAAQAWAPEFLDDLYDLPDGQAFTVFSCKDQGNPRLIGIGFKFTEPMGRRRLVWLNNRRLREACKSFCPLIQDAAARYGVFHKPLPWS